MSARMQGDGVGAYGAWLAAILGFVLAAPASAGGIPAPIPGDVFAFGESASSRTCLGGSSDALVPTPIDATNLGGVQFVEVGAAHGSPLGLARHSLLVASDGRLFSCGSNNSYRTGQGIISGETSVATLLAPSALDGRPIDQISVGGAFNLILSDGVVYYLGNASAGQGLGTTDTVTTPTPITSLNAGDLDIVQVSAGSASSFVLREDGVVLSWGDRIDGMLGQGPLEANPFFPAPILTTNIGEQAIVQVDAGDRHTLFLTENGTVFAAGTNADGRTGLGTDEGETDTPTAIDTTHLGAARVIQVSAGEQHSLLLTEDGDVYAFGSNVLGATGLGTTQGDTSIATPIDATNLGTRRVAQVEAGGVHSVLRTEDGRVYTFGSNASTGLDTTTGQTAIATALPPLGENELVASDVSAGGQHTLVVATVPEPTAGGPVAIALLALARRLGRRVRAD